MCALYGDARQVVVREDNTVMEMDDEGGASSAVSAASAASGGGKERRGLLVADAVAVIHAPPDRAILRWQAAPMADTIADSLVALLAQAEFSATSLRAAIMGAPRHSHGSSSCCGGAPAAAAATAAAAAAGDDEASAAVDTPRKLVVEDDADDGAPSVPPATAAVPIGLEAAEELCAHYARVMPAPWAATCARALAGAVLAADAHMAVALAGHLLSTFGAAACTMATGGSGSSDDHDGGVRLEVRLGGRSGAAYTAAIAYTPTATPRFRVIPTLFTPPTPPPTALPRPLADAASAASAREVARLNTLLDAVLETVASALQPVVPKSVSSGSALPR